MDNVELEFTDAALEVAADQAIEQGTGARALRSILEHTLLDVMYELPTLNNIARCAVDADAIRGGGGRVLDGRKRRARSNADLGAEVRLATHPHPSTGLRAGSHSSPVGGALHKKCRPSRIALRHAQGER